MGQHHDGGAGGAAVAFPNVLPHDQVHDAGFVFERDERDPLRGARPLPQEHDAGDFDPLARIERRQSRRGADVAVIEHLT